MTLFVNPNPTVDPRDYKFIPVVPPKPYTDLRPLNRNMKDQADQSNCGPFGFTNAAEIMAERAGQFVELSPQFLYYTTQEMSGLLGREGVHSIRDMLEAARKFGVCLESEWPTSSSNKDVMPSAAAYLSAATRKVKRYEAIDISKSNVFGDNPQLGIDNINSALAEDMPVLLNISIGEKFMTLQGPIASQNYYPFDPPGTNTGNQHLIAHIVNIVANNDAERYWLIENQWKPNGQPWGDGGYGRIPYDCIRDFNECFIVREFGQINYTDQVRYFHQMRLVRLYVAVLDRAPELAGMLWWSKDVANGAPIGDVAQGFLLGEESRARFLRNGDAVMNIIDNLPMFENKVKVAAYCVLDLACDDVEISKVVLQGVTDDPATVEIGYRRVRTMMGGGKL